MKTNEKTKIQKGKSLSRRNFISTVGAASAAFTIIPRHALGGIGYTAPSDLPNIAGIGVGGRGGSDLRAICDPDGVVAQPERITYEDVTLAPDRGGRGGQNPTRSQAARAPVNLANIYALCDVDEVRAGNTFRGYPKAKRYQDFRLMLEKEKDIDAVVIATPDHTHGVIAMMAIGLGKHVYCEKPLAHSLNQVRMITEAAREKGVMTQMGNQGHSANEIREVVEAVNAGIIGNVTEVIAWCDRPAGGGGVSFPHGIERPTGEYAIPQTLNWDLWLGPAPERPYNPMYAPAKWRGFLDFGCGALGDFACHTLDPAFWALDLGSPTSIIASTTNELPNIKYDTYPTSSIIEYRFPARNKRPPVKLTWYDGGALPVMDERFANIDFGTNGALLIGDKGIIQHGSHGAVPYKITLYNKNAKIITPPQTIERVAGHQIDWINAIKTGKPSSANFNYGGPLTETVLLGVVASLFRNKRVEWDAKNMKFNIEEANAILYPEFRKGWKM